MTRCALLAVLLAAGCQSYESTLVEFDSVTGTTGGEVRGMQLKDEVDRLPWGIRQVECTGLDWLLVRAFGIERTPHTVDDPVRMQRERMRDLWHKAPYAPVARAEAVVRLLLVADRRQEPRGLHRADALQGLALLAESLTLPAAPPPRLLVESPESAAATRELVRQLVQGWPAGRSAPRTRAETDAFLVALTAGAQRDWFDPAERRLWLRALVAATWHEDDSAVATALADALTASMARAVAAALWDGVVDPAPMVREQAARALIQALGPSALPALLQRMTAGGRRTAGGLPRLDPDTNVVRMLVNQCAEADLALARHSFEAGPTVLEFLEQVATGEDPGLHMVGMLALCRVLGRELSYDPAWLHAWVQAGRPLTSSAPARQ